MGPHYRSESRWPFRASGTPPRIPFRDPLRGPSRATTKERCCGRVRHMFPSSTGTCDWREEEQPFRAVTTAEDPPGTGGSLGGRRSMYPGYRGTCDDGYLCWEEETPRSRGVDDG